MCGQELAIGALKTRKCVASDYYWLVQLHNWKNIILVDFCIDWW